MLAYVFVHRPAAEVDSSGYSQKLAGFHRALALEPPAGFISSWVWRLDDGPLGPAWEDWYLVDSWAALGTLNHDAVTGLRQSAHDGVAPLSGTGAGAVYRLTSGAPTMAARCRTRITKPDGMRYRAFQPELERLAGIDGALWQRQMVLGPDTEFLIDTPSAPDGRFNHPMDVTALHLVHGAGA